MEFEQLETGRRCILAAIASQDVGDYYNILHPDVVLVSHFRYPAMPLTVVDTIPLLALAHRRGATAKAPAAPAAPASKRSSPAPSAPTPSPAAKRPTPSPAAKRPTPSPAAPAAPAAKRSSPAAPRGRPLSSPPAPEELDALPYDARVDVAEGRLLVAERMYGIFSWLNRQRYIADTSVELEVRKVILQESEVLSPAPSPRNEAERYAAMGRQHTDRNQRLSRLLVRWGHEDLLFRDECYFEDGLIVTVQRFLVSQREMLELSGDAELHHVHMQQRQQRRIDAMAAARKSFYAVRASRIDAFDHATLPLLDFTFVPADDAVKLLTAKPVAGRKHVERTVEPVSDAQMAQGVFLNQQSDPFRPKKDHHVIVKARNKQGDEKVYEFVENNSTRYNFMRTGAAQPTTSYDILAEKVKVTYATTSVRISGCGMEATEYLVPVLRRLVVNSIMTLHSLDLSDNRISVLPDFSPLPLQRLQLQKNKISDWAQVEKSVCPLPLLSAVSLHGNPISENDENYFQQALARLMRHPNRVVQLRQLDLVTLTAQDYNMAATYEMFQTGNTKLLEETKKRIARGTNSLCRYTSTRMSSSSSSPAVIASVEAYATALLHCQKYPAQAVSGFLLGKRLSEPSDGCGRAFVAEAIPLFHSLPMTHPHPMLEVAHAQVSNFARTKGLVMLGYYVANERADDRGVSPLTARVLRMLRGKLSAGSRPVLWTVVASHPADGVDVRVSFNDGSDDTPAEPLTFGRWKSDTLSCETVEAAAAAAMETFSNAMDAFKQFHLVDFEDHLENVQLNYLEQANPV